MRSRFLAPVGGAAFVLVGVSLLPSAAGQVPKPPSPLGAPAPLLLCGGETADAEARGAFVRLAGGKQARLVMVKVRAETPEDLLAWGGLVTVAVRTYTSGQGAEPPAAFLERASGIWIAHDEPQHLRKALAVPRLRDALRAAFAKGTPIGASGAAAEALGGQTPKGPGLGLWPQVVVDRDHGGKPERLSQLLRKHPGHVGIGLDDEVGVLLVSRSLRNLGRKPATLALAASKTRPERTQPLNRPLDFNTLSRAAIARTETPYPPPAFERHAPPKGTLIAAGGGRMPASILRAFIEAAGGPLAPLVIIPTAMADPIQPPRWMVSALKRAGCQDVQVVHARTPEKASDPSVLKPLKKARGVWFGGGRQWRLVDAYLDTEAHALLWKVLEHGGVIAGSSAGATIQGGYLVRGHPLGNRVMMAEGYERGLGFLEGIAIDQHFAQRNRFADLSAVKRAHPQLLCLGIDESTAVLVRGREMRVLGRHGVAVYDRDPKQRFPDGKDHTLLSAGDRYDLVDRGILAPK